MKNILVLFVLIFAGQLAYGQPDPQVFDATKVVWCGLDYSNVKFLGPKEEFEEPFVIKNKYFQAWNNLVLTAPDRYDFDITYKKTEVITDLSVVNRRNSVVPELKDLWGDEGYQIPARQLSYIIAGYSPKKAQEGLGLVFVVETLNKIKENAAIHVIFFDIATKAILWSKRYIGAAGGADFKSYWAEPLYNVLQISGEDFKKEFAKYSK